MQVLVVDFRIKAEHIAEFEAAMLDNAHLSRETEPGCRQFDVCRSASDPSQFYLYELYDDEAAVQAHLQSAHFLRMNAQTAGWVAAKTVWRYTRQSP